MNEEQRDVGVCGQN